MKGNKLSLGAKIGAIADKSKVRQRILIQILPLFLSLPRRVNFTQMTKWGEHNEMTYHNWLNQDLDLITFNRQLIDENGSGDHFVIFDPSFLSKSGKKTAHKGRFWSGGAGMTKLGLEMSCFAVGDMKKHTAYHLSSTLTPSPKELKETGKTLINYYVSQVQANKAHIKHFGNLLVSDTYFGVSTFVQPVVKMGIDIISCLKGNSCLFYVPQPIVGKRQRGRPAKKAGKIDWLNLDNDKLLIVEQDAEKIVRSALVYVQCLKMTVLLVAVDYLKEDGTRQTRKLYFSNRTDFHYAFVLKHYQCRFQIEFLFRDAKQFTGLMHCQSTNSTKLLNHINLSLTAISVAKVAHWEENKPFSMEEIKNYYHNLRMVELFSEALGLDTNSVKNNPKIIKLLISNDYEAIAA
ncbi:MAG: transposase [Saprospiraceae bacterium]|nr:transposase [Saprospiraceae bacterium]